MTRRGAMLVELAVAGALVGALLTVGLQLLGAAAAHRRAADQRQFALIELDNVLEQIAGRPWNELTSATLSQEKLSPSAAQRLPGAELKIEVVAPPDDPDAKRITAAIVWQDRSGRPVAPTTLTTWRYEIVD